MQAATSGDNTGLFIEATSDVGGIVECAGSGFSPAIRIPPFFGVGMESVGSRVGLTELTKNSRQQQFCILE